MNSSSADVFSRLRSRGVAAALGAVLAAALAACGGPSRDRKPGWTDDLSVGVAQSYGAMSVAQGWRFVQRNGVPFSVVGGSGSGTATIGGPDGQSFPLSFASALLPMTEQSSLAVVGDRVAVTNCVTLVSQYPLPEGLSVVPSTSFQTPWLRPGEAKTKEAVVLAATDTAMVVCTEPIEAGEKVSHATAGFRVYVGSDEVMFVTTIDGAKMVPGDKAGIPLDTAGVHQAMAQSGWPPRDAANFLTTGSRANTFVPVPSVAPASGASEGIGRNIGL